MKKIITIAAQDATSAVFTCVGVDPVKNALAIHGINAAGKRILVKPRVPRKRLLNVPTAPPPCTIGMEACSGARRGRLPGVGPLQRRVGSLFECANSLPRVLLWRRQHAFNDVCVLRIDDFPVIFDAGHEIHQYPLSGRKSFPGWPDVSSEFP